MEWLNPLLVMDSLRSYNWAQIRANDLLNIKQQIKDQIFYSYIYNFLDTVFF